MQFSKFSYLGSSLGILGVQALLLKILHSKQSTHSALLIACSFTESFTQSSMIVFTHTIFLLVLVQSKREREISYISSVLSESVLGLRSLRLILR
jgi:hypothetical protein